jgi:uncharacterized damage-inducible protein DinB
MLTNTIIEMLNRDARKVIDEIALYKNEETIWKIVPGIANSAGNLCLHLTGNLNHFIGALLGKTGYIRNRENEFAATGLKSSELIKGMEDTISVMQQTFDKLTDSDLEKTFPVDKHGQIVTTGYMMLHLMTHLNYHLGQINYHRRLLEQ